MDLIRPLILLAIIFCLGGCKSTDVGYVTDVGNKNKTVELIQYKNSLIGLQPGNCYHRSAVLVPERQAEKSKPFLIETLSPKFKRVKAKYRLKELKIFQVANDLYRLPIKDKYCHFELTDKLDPRLGRSDTTKHLSYEFCYICNNKEYSTFTIEELRKMKMTIYEEVVIEEAFVRIIYGETKPIQLTENQLFFESYPWTSLTKSTYGDTHYQLWSPRQVEEKLKSLGYEAIADNIIDEREKKAIKDFQKKNGLKEGKITIETVRALGLIDE